MKKYFWLLMACVMLNVPAYIIAEPKDVDDSISQERVQKMESKREKSHKKRLERLEKELGLTPEQKEKISKILHDNWTKTKEEMKKMREVVKKIRQETDKQIEKLLTQEQVEKFRKMSQEMAERRKKRSKKHCDEMSEYKKE